MIEFTDSQMKAINECVSRIRSGEAVTRLCGYAGTGKTTIASAIADEVCSGNGSGGDGAVYGSYTGKAASVLARKSGRPTGTIHSMFYAGAGEVVEKCVSCKRRSALPAQGGGSGADCRVCKRSPLFEFSPLKFRDAFGDVRLIVLDEVSMVDSSMARDIVSCGVPVLAIGDPAQLPPVGGGDGFGLFSGSEAMLTQVMRHDNDVLALATDIRSRGVGALRSWRSAGLVVSFVGQSRAAGFSQVLVGRNATRVAKNAKMRELLGRGGDGGGIVEAGDRIICTENNKQFHGVLNGVQFRVLEADSGGGGSDGIAKPLLACECGVSDGSGSGECPVCKWVPHYVPMWTAGFSGDAEELARLSSMKYYSRQRAMVATYGYAITVHKAQGSEWDSVLVVDESSCFRKDAARWLYTAVTRAQSRVTVIRR